MVEYSLALLGIINALAVIIPGIVLLLFIRGVKVPTLRNLTLLLALFGLLHGLYHILLLAGMFTLANPVDLITVLLLVLLGIYYNLRAS